VAIRRPSCERSIPSAGGRLLAVMSLDVAESQIQGVTSIINPDKLRHLEPLADLEALLRERS
jgi:RNA polymerase sigma-70 factor (ECF subfamily)